MIKDVELKERLRVQHDVDMAASLAAKVMGDYGWEWYDAEDETYYLPNHRMISEAIAEIIETMERDPQQIECMGSGRLWVTRDHDAFTVSVEVGCVIPYDTQGCHDDCDDEEALRESPIATDADVERIRAALKRDLLASAHDGNGRWTFSYPDGTDITVTNEGRADRYADTISRHAVEMYYRIMALSP